MVDRIYAGTPADFAIALGAQADIVDEAGDPLSPPQLGWSVLIPVLPAEFDVYDIDSSQHTDLLDHEGTPTATVSSSGVFATVGQILSFTVNDAPPGDVYLVSTGGTPFVDPTFRLSPTTDEIFTRLDELEVRGTSDLADVSEVPPTDGQILRFNNTSGEYEPASGVAPTSLGDLSDVSTAGSTIGQALVRVAGNQWAPGTVSGGGGVTAHSGLTGLDADDHQQYLNQTRGDLRYHTKAEVEALAATAAAQNSGADRARANHTGSQPISSVSGLQAALNAIPVTGSTAGSAARFWGLYNSFGDLPSMGPVNGDIALYVVD